MVNVIKKIVLGKELIFTKKIVSEFMHEEFSYNTKIQDLWLENGDIHIRVFCIVGKNGKSQLIDNGFKEVKKMSEYKAVEKVDSRFKQIIDSIKLLKFYM